MVGIALLLAAREPGKTLFIPAALLTSVDWCGLRGGQNLGTFENTTKYTPQRFPEYSRRCETVQQNQNAFAQHAT